MTLDAAEKVFKVSGLWSTLQRD